MSEKEKNTCGSGCHTEHEHECDCEADCGCEEEVLTLIDENGEERDFAVIDIVEVDGMEYAILLPVEEDGGEESDEAIILRFEKDEDCLLYTSSCPANPAA